MASFTRLSILAFGISSFFAGLITLMNPSSSLDILHLPRDAIPAIRGNALAAIAMGIYYCLAAYQHNVPFYYATVPMRGLTTIVFWAQGWYAASIWEGLGSITTALALSWESLDTRKKDQ